MSHVYSVAGAAHSVFDKKMTVMRIRIPSVFPVFVVICQQGMGILIQYGSSPLSDCDHCSYDRGSSEQIDGTVDDIVPEVQFPPEQETRA